MVTPVHSFHFENLKAMHLLLTIATPAVHYGEAARQNQYHIQAVHILQFQNTINLATQLLDV
jgi:hypothetical protein